MWGNLNTSGEGNSGGFLNESRSGARDKEPVKRSQNIVSVMIGHLTNSIGDLKIWDFLPVHTVTFVGILRSIEHMTTKTTYEIEDETGRITAFRWLEAEKNAIQDGLEINTYIRVYGHLREQNEKRHILILKISPITDLNELTNHLLEVTFILLKSEKMKNAENDQSTANNMTEVTMCDDNLSGLTKEQTIVFKLIEENNESENGIERDTLKNSVPKFILPSVDNIIDFLTSEGHIYTTLTDDHFKTT